MNHVELQQTYADCCNVAASYCRTSCAKGGVCTHVHKSLKFVRRGLEKTFKEKDFEACALKIHLNFKSVCIITIHVHRAPSGNFNSSVNKLV